ncbi:hypothetical protein QR680_004654 [Steinernema hermaphroditum]|uniref:Uncharacterized protein n=1 Tax=Steinernema hermaphroditum TaxID=289476 RepID=A0AA39HPD9_9BILA|nr:hypothetical protein QR680_004654 [Steinernema hermaphroditum]
MVSVSERTSQSQDGSHHRLPTIAPPGSVIDYEVRHSPPPPYNGSGEAVSPPAPPAQPPATNKPRVTFNLPPPTPSSSTLSPRHRRTQPEGGCCHLIKRSILPALICVGIVVVIVVLAIFVFKGNGNPSTAPEAIPK